MTEHELRTLVRDAITRHLGADPAAVPENRQTFAPAHPRTFAPPGARTVAPSYHASHGLFVLQTGSDADGPCIIEPAVPCNHCGYCRSYGH